MIAAPRSMGRQATWQSCFALCPGDCRDRCLGLAFPGAHRAVADCGRCGQPRDDRVLLKRRLLHGEIDGARSRSGLHAQRLGARDKALLTCRFDTVIGRPGIGHVVRHKAQFKLILRRPPTAIDRAALRLTRNYR